MWTNPVFCGIINRTYAILSVGGSVIGNFSENTAFLRHKLTVCGTKEHHA